MRASSWLILLAVAFAVSAVPAARAEHVRIAVASNFTKIANALGKAFEEETGHPVSISAGSTGKLYAQIISGAPFDVFLAADQVRPALLEEEGHAVPGSRFTYAVGRLALWGADPGAVGPDGPATLRDGSFRRLAMANPALAPYGAAAEQTLRKLQVWEAVSGRVVMGENIAQTHAMVATGNAELGFVAWAQLVDEPPADGDRWDVPAHLHSPIRQDAVLLKHAADSAAARAFMAFLTSPAAALIEAAGYEVE